MDINNFPPEFVDDIKRASFTNRYDSIQKWLNNFSEFKGYRDFRLSILNLINKKYDSIEYMKKRFNATTNGEYKNSIHVHSSDYYHYTPKDDFDYIQCLKEEINKINERNLNDTATNKDIEFRLFLKMILDAFENDEIITDVFKVFRHQSMSPLLLKKN